MVTTHTVSTKPAPWGEILARATQSVQASPVRFLSNSNVVNLALERLGWFRDPGAYVLVDGQYGSTGKGLLASVLGEYGAHRITQITTNAGPNSGHTAYSPVNGRKIVTQQVPIATVVATEKLGGLNYIPTQINAGAVVDADILMRELSENGLGPNQVHVHNHAALISDADRATEATGTVSKIASTAKGVGAALARKVLRDPTAVVFEGFQPPNSWNWKHDRVFVETAQGFSLGINSGFYPATTSRECSVQMALSDAQIPARRLRKVAACYRTFPIRVGNTDVGNSGGVYPDQKELTWEQVGVEPEITTVTKRVRRVFSWSRQQFRDSVRVNEPDLVFVNFLNYLPEHQHSVFMATVIEDYVSVMGRNPELVLVGFGPFNGDVMLWSKR